VSRHASTALWNSQEYHKIFLKPLLKALGSPWRMFRGRTLAIIGGVLAGVITLVAIMAFVPCDLLIAGHGSLLPEQRHKVYAPHPGVVIEVPVDHGARVHKGDVIVKLESRDLQKELKQLIAEKAKAEHLAGYLELQVDKARSSQSHDGGLDIYQLQAQISEAKITAKNSGERMEIVQEQLDSLTVQSPQDGIITTFEARKNLIGRPVDYGTELLQVAATEGEWILEVEVPDDDMGPILAARSRLEEDIKAGRKPVGTPLEADFVAMTDPDHRYRGYVRRIAPEAETIGAADTEQYKNRHVAKVTIGFSDAVLQDYLQRNQIKEPRPGAEVRARVDCGKTSIAYYIFRKPIQFLYETILFRWPFLH
jgi:Biotin-lipoyl like/HlyD family secretion protein